MDKAVGSIVSVLRTVNRGVATVCGVALLVTVGFILLEILLRRITGGGLGGSDEVSGYVMAAIATWGLSWALTERAHVRIDLFMRHLGPESRAGLDILAMLSVAATAAVVTFHAWSVLDTTLARGSLANTPLQTPLWIPQTIWFGGWVWFTVTAWALAVCLILAVVRGRFEQAADIGGTEGGA